MSIWVSKSGSKALVPQDAFGTAFLSSVCWAGALAIGCMLGSLGLLIALQTTLGDTIVRQLSERYQFGPDGAWNLLFLYDWIIRDSFSFVINLSLILFVGNRVRVARKRGGLAWLAILPPLFAVGLSFLIEHGEAIVQLATNLSEASLAEIWDALIAEFVVPFEMLAKAFYAPDETLNWARSSLIETDGSFFRLATFFPWIFLLVTISFAARHLLFGTGAVVDA
jgi:hypothetical protein